MAPNGWIQQMLSSVDLFSQLSPRELQQVENLGKQVEFEADRKIATAGASGIAFHLILEGEATVETADGRTERLGPGDYFGEIALIDGQPRSATVTAATRLRTLSLVSWDFRDLLVRTPSISFKLLEALCRRLHAAESATAS